MTKLPVSFVNAHIDHAYAALESACYAHGIREVREVYALELKAEKEHRAFGKRFTDGRAGYRVNAVRSAKLQVLRRVFDGATTARTVADLYGRRASVILANVLGARMVGQPFADWMADLESFGAMRLSAMLNAGSGAEFQLMQDERRKYGEPIAVPTFLGIDYARDCAA